MKKVGKINILFQIFVLYCFMASLYSTTILSPEISFQNNHHRSENGYFQKVGTDILTQTTKPVNVVNDNKNLPTFSFKNHANDYLSVRRAAESYLLNIKSQYICLAKNIVVRLQPTDIIFPSHYFW